MRPGAKVNIELAFGLSSRLGATSCWGHGTRSAGPSRGGRESVLIRVSFERAFGKYVVCWLHSRRRISAVNEVLSEAFSVNVIPHTLLSTSLTLKSAGDRVNLEFDVLGKYVENLLNKDKGTSLKDLLAKQGFLKEG